MENAFKNAIILNTNISKTKPPRQLARTNIVAYVLSYHVFKFRQKLRGHPVYALNLNEILTICARFENVYLTLHTTHLNLKKLKKYLP